MEAIHYISTKALDLNTLSDLLLTNKSLVLSDEAIAKIQKCRQYLDDKMEGHDDPIYGINTGFGALYNVKISSKDLTKLQENLVMSHACGTGDIIPNEIVKLMLLLKIQSLCYGHSGVQLQTVNRLIGFYNNDILPIVYSQGSLGASGDLAPLAHLSLPLIGKGKVWHDGKIVEANDVLKSFNWKPVQLQSKVRIGIVKRNSIYECLRNSFVAKAPKAKPSLSVT